jgi:hypothetical protein
MGHDDDAVDPESDEGKQQEFEEAAIGSEHGDMVLTGYSKGRWQNCDVTQKYAHRSNNPKKLPVSRKYKENVKVVLASSQAKGPEPPASNKNP